MKTTSLSIILITLSILDLFTLTNYGVIDWLHNYGKPVEALMILTFVPLVISVIGFILMVTGIKK